MCTQNIVVFKTQFVGPESPQNSLVGVESGLCRMYEQLGEN